MMTYLAVLTLFILGALVVFQLALILGAPIGKFAWGGQHTKLPQKLRVASISSIALYVLFAAFIASKAELAEVIPHGTLLTAGMWVFTCYFLLGIPLNAISRSKAERYTMTPVVTLLAVAFLLVSVA